MRPVTPPCNVQRSSRSCLGPTTKPCLGEAHGDAAALRSSPAHVRDTLPLGGSAQEGLTVKRPRSLRGLVPVTVALDGGRRVNLLTAELVAAALVLEADIAGITRSGIDEARARLAVGVLLIACRER